jgi:endoglucanase
MKELLKKLAQTPAASGYESGIRDVIREEIKPYVKEIKVDALGNLIARLGEKKENGLRIMVAAHMDEIGVMASHVEKDGTVRFSNLGSVIPRYLPGNRVRFLNGVRGVIDSDKPEDLGKIQPLNQFFIDVGATSEKDCPVKAGDVAVFDREFTDLGQRVVSKALDDRSSCALLVEAIKSIKDTPHELNLVFSAQEEVSSRGATTAAYSLDVDLGLALDVTPVGHLMGVKLQVDLGKGPAIKVRDVGFIADTGVVNWMVDGAKAIKIPYQIEVLDIGSTDARVMQLSKAGMRSGVLSLPCRYVHSPSEMIDMVDYEYALKLLVHLLSQPVKLR